MSKLALLQVKNLRTCFEVEEGTAWAIDDLSFDVYPDEILGIVGESGCGKSVTALSVMRLIPEPPGRIAQGQVIFRGQDLLKLEYADLRKIRGRDIAMIFQEPMTSLNPVFTIGKQVMEPLLLHEHLSPKTAKERSIEVLAQVGIPDAGRRLGDYPHQFSGGMRQRVMIAMALVCEPVLLIADEPTTALDVTIQAQILDLMVEIQSRRKESSIILITHDLAVVAETCDRVIVMYGGKIQEIASIHQIFDKPLHPYTRGLLDSIPDRESRGKRLRTIEGSVPSLLELPQGCKFCTRCSETMDRCRREEPALKEASPGHWVRCHLMEELELPSRVKTHEPG